jgi:hypothetical protein
MRSFIICNLHHILQGGQLKEDDMNGACIAQGGDENSRKKFWLECLKGKIPLGRPRREDNIKMYTTEIVFAGVDWIHVA